MGGYITRRLSSLLIVWAGVTVLAFGLGHFARGNPAEIYLERTMLRPATEDEIRETEQRMGLDRSLVVQYADWVSDAVRGDLSTSWSNDVAVSALLRQRFPHTAALAGMALIVGLFVAIPSGVAFSYFRNSAIDHLGRTGASLAASFPSFVLAYALIFLFGVRLRLLPLFGFGSPKHFVLPVLALALLGAADLTRVTRSTMLDVLREDYVTTARAKGVSRSSLLFKHALRNALNPIVTLSGLRLGYLLAGAVIVESIFAWPGLGTLVLEGIYARDYPLIQGFVLFTGTIFVLINLIVDLTYAWLDPRVRLQGAMKS